MRYSFKHTSDEELLDGCSSECLLTSFSSIIKSAQTAG